MILVTGATGTVGSEVLRLLCTRGHAARGLVRSPERADTLRGLDCEVAVGDYADPGSLDAALHGVRAVFLVAPVGPELATQECAVLDAVERAGSPPVLALATAGFDRPEAGRLGAAHTTVVRRLRSSGLVHTVLAPTDFFQNLTALAAVVQERGVLPDETGGAAVASVDARDVAAAAVELLVAASYDGSVVTVTGPAALTGADRARALSAALGREIRCVQLSPDEARAALAARLPTWEAEAVLERYAGQRAGSEAAVTDDVHRLLGRPPRGLEEFVREHRGAFAAAS